MELLRIKQAEEEKERQEKERLAYLEQEENDKRALLERESQIFDAKPIESQVVEEEEEEEEEEASTNETQQQNEQNDVVPESESDIQSTQILPLNFEILVNQALNNELQVPNLALQLENLKVEESINEEIEVETPKLGLPALQHEIFEAWHKHNNNNFFENIKQEYETKIKKFESNKSNEQTRTLRPRTSKTKQIQNIPENLILKKSSKNTLSEIYFLYIQSLTAYTLNTLELCTNLTVLVITNSQISILDGLQNCGNLKYINVQSNKIEWVDLRNLSQLIYLNLSNNCLSSIQNFSNCVNLRYLNISQNKFTRLGFLNHDFENLQFLNVSNNQLINTIGLSSSVNLQFVDLSCNNLNAIEDIDSLALLLELNGAKNNLLQIPDLTNQILLTALQLNDNSITTMIEMKNSWMPLLKLVQLSQNCVDEIMPLNGLFNIDKLLVENNNLCDIESVKDVTSFRFISEVYLTNNPIVNEEKIEIEGFSLMNESTTNCLKLVKETSKLNDQDFSDKYHGSIEKIRKFIDFHKLKANSLIEKYQNGADQQVLSGLDELLVEFNILRDFVIKLRFMFEANDLNSILNVDTQINNYIKVPSRPPSARTHEKNRIYSARLERIKGLRSSVAVEASSRESTSVAKSIKKEDIEISPLESYKSMLQKKYSIEQLNNYASLIQSQWKGYKTRKDLDRQVANMAATIIQSRWRGYLVRKRIEEARRKFNEENQFEFEEIDLNQFEFDETKFDIKVPVMTTSQPQKQFINAFLNAASSKPPLPPATHLPPVIGLTKKAWKSGDTPRTNSATSYIQEPPMYDMRQHNVPMLYTGRSVNTASTRPDSEAMIISGKHDVIVNDWGFKDHRTAMLMLQRADKMKYKVERKNKLKSLDPKERLKLLRKLDKYTPRVTTTNRNYNEPVHYINPVNVEYPTTSQPPPLPTTTQNRTYEWLHSQVREIPIVKPEAVSHPPKVTKLPQIQVNNRNGSSGSSNGTTPVLKQPQQHTSKPHHTLPPLNNLKLNINNHDHHQIDDEYSIPSSRSSFTNMFLNTKKPKTNEFGIRRKKK